MEFTARKKLREGITTGSCAAAAAQASALRALGRPCPQQVQITTPQGRILSLPVLPLAQGACGVVKDAGDDPDATDGMTVVAQVQLLEDGSGILFRAGEGVGTVTLPGLKVPVGEAAVNPVPRRMITEALHSVLGSRGALVTLSIPGGAERAAHTFNPRLGIEGGLSILGTTGIVRPMNEEAIFESLTLELSTHAAAAEKVLALTFGNTGEQTLRKAWDITGRRVVQVGNYLGYVLDEAVRLGFERILLCGHPGKLLKVAAGTFSTHNRTGDGRLEALCTHAALAGCGTDVVRQLYASSTTEQAMEVLRERELDFLWSRLAEAAAKRCRDRAFNDIAVETAFIDKDSHILGSSSGAASFAEELRHGQ